MDVVLNEKAKAKEIIESKQIYINLWKTKELLVKYYYKESKDKEYTREKVIEFLKCIKTNVDGREYNIIKDMESIKKAVNIYTKDSFRLSDAKTILISKDELERIKGLKNEPLEKLAFILLVVCKIQNTKTNKFTNWINNKTREFYKYSKNRGGVEYQELMLHRLYKSGLIGFAHVASPDSISIQLNYIDRKVNKDDAEIEIGDFREVVLYYLQWKGVNIKQCEKCNKKILNNTGSKKYCSPCSTVTDRENARIRMQSKRKGEMFEVEATL